MRRSRGLTSAVLALLVLAACAPGPTELVVVVDTDLVIPSELDEVRITVTRPDGTTALETRALTNRSLLPLTLGVVADGDVLGPIEVVAEGRLGGVHVVDHGARVRSLVRNEIRVLTLHLVRSCIGRTCTSATEACGPSGCEARDVSDLPSWTGSPPGLDAGPRDAGPPTDGALDGGMPHDAGGACTTDAQCDDGVACTADTCTASGCQHAPDDTRCDDHDPCTLDTCNAAMGCVPVPASGASCDDGVWCNGFDTCSSGTCSVHTGDPCAAPTTCDEAGQRCMGCATSADCPARMVGPAGACEWSGTCQESTVEHHTVRVFACMASACVPTDTTEAGPCSRTTEGMSCGVGGCGGFGACDYANECSTSAVMTQTCTDLVCRSGTCRGVDHTNTMPCSRATDGTSCGGGTSCGSYGACDYTDVCDTSAMRYRTCTDGACSGGTCASGAPRMEADPTPCTRTTDGTPCAGARVCSGGACTLCAITGSGAAGTVGMSYFTQVAGAGSGIAFTDGSGMASGTVSIAPGVSFSGSFTAPIAVWQVHASGNTITFVDWDGTTSGTITVSGATVSGSHAPPCVDSGYGCFPPYLDQITGTSSGFQVHDSMGGTTTFTFACP